MWTVGIALVVALGAAHVTARLADARGIGDLLKAVPIAILAALVALGRAPVDTTYRWLVLAGLLWSLAGDLWLLFPRGFVPGLLSFLIAHVFYISAFAPAGTWAPSTWALLLPFALGSLVMLGYLWPHLGRERAPVVVYVSVIAVMGWRAAVRALSTATPASSGALALAGALLFLVSDGLLATDRFARPFRTADAAVMTTYYAAQTLIALSIRG
jgi:uncharacterized membrane protein YhhN